MSSSEEFFDILYLGVFLILSPAFDFRFYNGPKPSQAIEEEARYSVGRFQNLLQHFSTRFIILLEGEPVYPWYVVDRMLGEFAASSVVFAEDIDESRGHMQSDESISSSIFTERVELILQESHPNVLPFYRRCLNRRHKDFVWTGPNLKIFRRSKELFSTIPLISKGEMLDYPRHPIYTVDLDPPPSATTIVAPAVGKRRDREESGNLAGQQSKKRKL